MSALPFDHLSFSSLNLFAGFFGCEKAWEFKYIDKVPRKPFGPGLLCGTAWGNTVDGTHQEQMRPSGYPDPSEAAERFVDNTSQALDTGDYDVGAKTIGELKDQGARASSAYVTEKAPTITPVAIQRKVTVAFEEVDWHLLGYVDLIEAADKGIIVTDHKSTMSSTKYDADKASIDFQLGLYDLALTIGGEDVVGRGFRSARILKTKYELDEAFVPSLPEQRAVDLDLLGNIAARVETACETGVFLPTARLAGSYKCSAKYCDFFDSVCPYGARARVQVAPGGVAA